MIIKKDPEIKCVADEDGTGRYKIGDVIVIAHSMARAEEVYDEFKKNGDATWCNPSGPELF